MTSLVIDTTKVAVLTAIAWAFALVGVAITRLVGLGQSPAHS